MLPDNFSLLDLMVVRVHTVADRGDPLKAGTPTPDSAAMPVVCVDHAELVTRCHLSASIHVVLFRSMFGQNATDVFTHGERACMR
ncbi:TPA: hypothetical protein QDC44_005894 [Burkholderia cepacia ATCC 25416]|uniref:hypothetical protein n=1 Tax=Burkholderia cepacia TaxID=292 RepID=UPI001CF1C56A|nr:hypothetical protein [Burkholderia cepacia]HDR9761665.1 hypothetical protein [Burkholderia cepacia ATCC 25416]